MMSTKIFLSKSARQTQKLAAQIVRKVLSQKGTKTAVVLSLTGELGGGKTTFVQGLAKALGVKERITSPTFVILKRFTIDDLRFKNLFHIDCYRVENKKEILALDFKKIISDPKNLVVIEWAEKIKSLIPKNAVWVKFEWMGEKKRNIIITNKNYTIGQNR